VSLLCKYVVKCARFCLVARSSAHEGVKGWRCNAQALLVRRSPPLEAALPPQPLGFPSHSDPPLAPGAPGVPHLLQKKWHTIRSELETMATLNPFGNRCVHSLTPLQSL
jgi:hypothetical protein